jgi:cobalamin synthase
MSIKVSPTKRFPLDFWICAVLFLLAAFFLAESRSYPIKATLFPTIMLMGTMALCVYIMGSSFLKRQKTLQKETSAQQEPAENPNKLKAVSAFGAITVLYALLTPYTGFGLSSLIFIGVGTAFFGERNKRAIAGTALAAVIFVYLFFIYFLNVNIPFFPSLL